MGLAPTGKRRLCTAHAENCRLNYWQICLLTCSCKVSESANMAARSVAAGSLVQNFSANAAAKPIADGETAMELCDDASDFASTSNRVVVPACSTKLAASLILALRQCYSFAYSSMNRKLLTLRLGNDLVALYKSGYLQKSI